MRTWSTNIFAKIRISSEITRLAIAIIAVFICFVLVAVLSNRDVFDVIQSLVIGGWGSWNAVSESAVKSIPILLCAIAAAIPGRFGLINLGGEGQLILGAIGATAAAIVFSETAAPWLIAYMFLSACLFGCIWGLLPGVIHSFTNASETVISLLLNYVAGYLLLHLIHGPWKDPSSFGWAQTVVFSDPGQLTGLFGSRIHVMAFWGIGICVILALISHKTPMGILARIVSYSRKTALYIGVNTPVFLIIAFCLGGAIAGLAGMGEVSAIHGRLRDGISSQGYGYVGFLVAWLCRNRFEWLPLASLAFGGLLAGADLLQISLGLPAATIKIVIGMVLLMLIVSESTKLGGSTK